MGNSYRSRVSGMYRRVSSKTTAIAIGILKGLGSSVSLRIADDLERGQLLSVVSESVLATEYTDASSFRDDYLACELLSKYQNFDLGVDRVEKALEKFLDAEKQCSESNFRLRQLRNGSFHSQYTPLSILSMASLKIAALLGPFSWDKAEPYFGFGPGSTWTLPRRRGDAYYKFGLSRPSTTQGNSIVALTALRRVPRWLDCILDTSKVSREDFDQMLPEQQVATLFETVPGNRVTTVPKNAKIDRVIAVEPDMNMYIQKGIGGLIRSSLKRVGIDLNDQEPNQVLAQKGSLDGSLSTIDLSSASDTISNELVELLLPPDWSTAIKLCRSPRGVLPDGSLINYHKVSSMGNGFTFELESLIFWALCKSVYDHFSWTGPLLVYGDDIIVSSHLDHTVRWILNFSGFTVNPKKSFATGPFRESCGKHFFNGEDVTPFYIRDDIVSPHRLIHISNSIRSWSKLSYGLDGRMFNAYSLAVSFLPRSLQRPSIPESLGSIALWGDPDECRPTWSVRLHCFVATGLVEIPRLVAVGGFPYLLRSLSNLEKVRPSVLEKITLELKTKDNEVRVGTGAPSGKIEVRLPIRRWSHVNVPITLWEHQGPWLSS